MKFYDLREALLKGQKVSRKSWGRGSTKFFLQMEEMFLNKNIPEPDEFLELHMTSEDEGQYTINKWSLTDIEKEYDDWYIFSEEKKEELPKGWECPRCGLVHAPSVETCTCKPKRSIDEVDINKEAKEELVKDKVTDEDICEHDWSLYSTNYNTAGITYTIVCRKCHTFVENVSPRMTGLYELISRILQ